MDGEKLDVDLEGSKHTEEVKQPNCLLYSCYHSLEWLLWFISCPIFASAIISSSLVVGCLSKDAVSLLCLSSWSAIVVDFISVSFLLLSRPSDPEVSLMRPSSQRERPYTHLPTYSCPTRDQSMPCTVSQVIIVSFIRWLLLFLMTASFLTIFVWKTVHSIWHYIKLDIHWWCKSKSKCNIILNKFIINPCCILWRFYRYKNDS